MQNVDFSTLFSSSRSRVYLLWAALVGIGFVATHYYQNPNINAVWFVLSIIGFAYMYKVMPLGVSQMKKIYLSWIIPVVVGLIASFIAVHTSFGAQLIAYLGAFWLVVMAAGYVSNGVVDSPGLWYYIVAAVNVAAAIAIYTSTQLLIIQYLLAATVSVWSMLMLWVFHSDV